MRPGLLLLLLSSLAACVVPPLDATGKACTTTCPAPLACELGLCVADGRLCAAWPEPTHACFDFEGSTTIDARQLVSGGTLGVDTSSRRFGANSLEARLDATGTLNLARLSIPVPDDWQRIAVGYDVFANLPGTTTDGISLGEILCAQSSTSSFTGVWLFHEGSPPRAVVRTGTASASSTDLLRALPAAEWTRVELELTRAPSPRGVVRLAGAEAANVPVSDCGGAWTVELGLSGHESVAAWYDDAVITVER
jgi:hypothetical protein